MEFTGATQTQGAWTIPSGSNGDFLLGIAFVPDTTVIDPQGWNQYGPVGPVTHAIFPSGTDTYRLEFFTTVRTDALVLPTFDAPGNLAYTLAMLAWDSPGTVTDTAFATVTSTASEASTPTLADVSVRVWAALGDSHFITPSRGTIVMQTNNINQHLAATLDTDPSPANGVLSNGGAAWCLASLALRGYGVAPPARLYPRADSLGVGSGRIFPPGSTRQAGRLNGPY